MGAFSDEPGKAEKENILGLKMKQLVFCMETNIQIFPKIYDTSLEYTLYTTLEHTRLKFINVLQKNSKLFLPL